MIAHIMVWTCEIKLSWWSKQMPWKDYLWIKSSGLIVEARKQTSSRDSQRNNYHFYFILAILNNILFFLRHLTTKIVIIINLTFFLIIKISNKFFSRVEDEVPTLHHTILTVLWTTPWIPTSVRSKYFSSPRQNTPKLGTYSLDIITRIK